MSSSLTEEYVFEFRLKRKWFGLINTCCVECDLSNISGFVIFSVIDRMCDFVYDLTGLIEDGPCYIVDMQRFRKFCVDIDDSIRDFAHQLSGDIFLSSSKVEDCCFDLMRESWVFYKDSYFGGFVPDFDVFAPMYYGHDKRSFLNVVFDLLSNNILVQNRYKFCLSIYQMQIRNALNYSIRKRNHLVPKGTRPWLCDTALVKSYVSSLTL